MDAVEDYVVNSVQGKVDIEVVESLLQPKNRVISPEYILKHSTRRGSYIFQLFDTLEKPKHFVASRRRWLKSQGKKTATSPPCPERTLKTPLPQQSSPSFREEEGQWVLMEDRRTRGFAFEKNCKNDWRYAYKSVFPFRKWPSRRGAKMAKRFSKSFGKESKRFVLPAGPGGMRS